MVHDFSNSLQGEHSHFNMANAFYQRYFKPANIIRADYNLPQGKELQKSDIDLHLDFGESRTAVSEKFRNKDYGDILLERYSKFPFKEGWMHHSKADFLAYFVPKKVYWVDKYMLRNFYQKQILPQLSAGHFRYLLKKNLQRNASCPFYIRLNGKKETLFLTQAYNVPKAEETEWYTMSICVPFKILKKAGVTFQVFALSE
jgi:hypothetical protein